MTVCAGGLAFDLIQFSLGGALSAIFTGYPYYLEPAALGWLISSLYVGCIFGACVGGWLCDRFGFRSSLAALMIWLGIGSLAAGLSSSPSLLAWTRMFIGLSLGAYPPLMTAYVREVTLENGRGRVFLSLAAWAYLAPPVASCFLRILLRQHPLGIEGWRWIYLLQVPFSLALAAGHLLLPEGPAWLRSHSQINMRNVPSSPALKENDIGKDGRPGFQRWGDWRIALLCAVYFLIPWASVGFPLVTGPALLARGVSLTKTLGYLTAAAAGPVISTLFTSTVIDRFGRRPVMIICASLIIIAISAFFLVGNSVAMAIAVISASALTSTYMAAMSVFGVELFPPKRAPSATSLAWGVNRIGAALAPIALLPLVRNAHIAFVMTAVGIALLVSILLLAIPSERRQSDIGYN